MGVTSAVGLLLVPCTGGNGRIGTAVWCLAFLVSGSRRANVALCCAIRWVGRRG